MLESANFKTGKRPAKEIEVMLINKEREQEKARRKGNEGCRKQIACVDHLVVRYSSCCLRAERVFHRLADVGGRFDDADAGGF